MIQFLCFFTLLMPLVPSDEDRFVIESEFGTEAEWTQDYLNDAWKVLVRLMDNRKVKPPMGIRVRLTKDPSSQGIGGYAGPEEIGFTSNIWPKDRYRLWIMAHELVNLFACRYAGSGGFPSDWWSNGRSPFPLYVSCLVMKELGYDEAADQMKKDYAGKPDHDLYWKLHERFGFKIFSRFLMLVRADGIDMGNIGKPWPHPDEVRSAYTMAYLSLAARENLAELIRDHGVGKEPPDWRRIHPEIPFPPYEVTKEEVDGVMAIRELLFEKKIKGKGAEILRELYMRGVLYLPSTDTLTDAPLSDSPMAFTVHSDFGAESEWTKAFLEQTATAFVKLFDLEEAPLPKHVPVTLTKVPDAGGIGGGATRESIELVSDCWPKEPFRLWILSQELAKMMGMTLGGNLPEDWWGHGNKPFASFASALGLKETGYAGESGWVHDLHRDKKDHEFFWKLYDLEGVGWVSRFFRLLREDGIDYEKIGEGSENPLELRTLYLAAYLSMACEKNLAKLCTSHGIGAKPPEWESRNPGVPFQVFQIETKEVDRLIELREKLFSAKKETAALRKARDRFRKGEVEF